MAKLLIKKGTTSKLIEVFIADSSSTTGAGLTGLVFNSAGLTAYYYRSGAASTVAITLVTMTLGTWASGGFIALDGTNMPGWYQIGLPDAALATGANQVAVHMKGATNMAPLPLELQLVDFDPTDAAALGLSRLDAAMTTRLAPTVAGRTLDVSATGEAGVDWANVGAPASALNLSGTTIGTLTTNSDKTGYSLSAAGIDAILDDAIAEPTGVFAWASATPRAILAWLGALARNKVTQTATTQTLRNDADLATVATAAIADDGTTATRQKWA